MNDRLPTGCRILVVSLTLAPLALARPYVARAAEEIDIAGEYACRGGNPDGGTYSGKVVITKTGQTYMIRWTIGAGQIQVGAGIREGNVLAVCFVSGGAAGVVAYKIEEGKDGLRLVGRWAGLGGQKTQSETLTRGVPAPRESPRVPRQVTTVFSRPPARAI